MKSNYLAFEDTNKQVKLQKEENTKYKMKIIILATLLAGKIKFRLTKEIKKKIQQSFFVKFGFSEQIKVF